jgi:hypothetical protein
MIRLSAAAFAAILMFATTTAFAGDTTPQGPVRLAQAYDQPMVIRAPGASSCRSEADPGSGVLMSRRPSVALAARRCPRRATVADSAAKSRRGHRFFGSYEGLRGDRIHLQRAGRPNGYILGEARRHHCRPPLRRGGALHRTRAASLDRQPSVGYDLGAEAPKPWSGRHTPRPGGYSARALTALPISSAASRHIPGRQPRYSWPNPQA